MSPFTWVDHWRNAESCRIISCVTEWSLNDTSQRIEFWIIMVETTCQVLADSRVMIDSVGLIKWEALSRTEEYLINI